MALTPVLGRVWGATVPNYPSDANLDEYMRFSPTGDCVAKEIRAYCGATTGAFKAYIRNADMSLLRDFGTVSLGTANAWNTISIADIALSSNVLYRLGSVCPGTDGIRGSSAGSSSTDYYKNATYSTFTPASTESEGTYETYDYYDSSLTLWGYLRPTISAYNPATGALAGLNFETAKGAGKLELCNDAAYASASVKVEQTTGTWADDAIASTPSFTGLTGGSTAYVFITTASGQINATGFSFTVPGSSANVSAGAGQTPGNEGAGVAAQKNASAGAGQTPGNEGAGVSSLAGSATGAGETAGNEGASTAAQENAATGAGQTPGNSGSGREAVPSSGPLVEYLINEATSGAGDGTVVDHAADPEDLEITYGGAYPAYVNDANGTGLNFGTARTHGMGAYNGPLDIGHKVFDALNGSKAVTFETVVKLPSDALGFYDIGNLFVVMQDNGYGCECGLWFWEEAGSQNFEISFIDQDCTGANFWDHYYIRHASMASYWGQRVVLHGVIDTANATEENRIRFYINGTRVTLSRTGGHTGIDVPQNCEIKITRPTEAPGLDGSTTNAPVYICAGGTPDYHAGSGTMRGEWRQGAIYDAILTDEEIESHATALLADDDTSFATTYNEAIGAGETAGNQGASVASQKNAAVSGGQTPGNEGASTAAQSNTSSASGQTPSSEGAGIASQENASAGAAQTAGSEGTAVAGQSNTATAAGQAPASEGEGVATQANAATGAGETPGNEGLAQQTPTITAAGSGQTPGNQGASVASQSNASTGEAQTPANEGLGVGTLSNAATASGYTPGNEGAAVGAQVNAATGDGQTPGNEGTQRDTIGATGEGQTPGNEGASTAAQKNSATATGQTPASEGVAIGAQSNAATGAGETAGNQGSGGAVEIVPFSIISTVEVLCTASIRRIISTVEVF